MITTHEMGNIRAIVAEVLKPQLVEIVNKYIEDRLQSEVRAAVKAELMKTLKELGTLI